MSHDEHWREQVRATLRGTDDGTPERAPSTTALAAEAIAQGTARLVAHASTRVALGGVLVVVVCALGAWRWSEVEAARTAEVWLAAGVSWIP